MNKEIEIVISQIAELAMNVASMIQNFQDGPDGQTPESLAEDLSIDIDRLPGLLNDLMILTDHEKEVGR